MASVLLENKTVSFTGAEVNAVSEEAFKMLPKTLLKQPEKKLVGQSHPPLRQFTGKLLTDNHPYHYDTYVVRGLRNNLSYRQFKLVRRLCSTEAESDTVPQGLQWPCNIWGRVHNPSGRWCNSIIMLSTLLEMYLYHCEKRCRS